MTGDSPTRIGIVTGEEVPALTGDGQAVRQELEDRGLGADPTVWSDTQVEWSTLDAVLLRSCWQYHTRPAEFRSWLQRLENAGVEVLNPVDAVRWNLHKFYLRDLASAGASVLPTTYVEQGSSTDLRRILQRHAWNRAVVKPAIGTSSAGVWRMSVEQAPEQQRRFEQFVSESDVLVQEFAPEIAAGERSLVFFGGEFSHATRSLPASDDFRAHPNYGGTTEAYDPPREIIDQAAETLRAAHERLGVDPVDLPYARVDGLERNGEFLLMELELIEPYLSLDTAADAVGTFADAIESYLNRHEVTTGLSDHA